MIKDVIADAFLQQILTRPADYDVVATPNLNGDYISDALAACVGGIGIAPGANINYVTGHAIFEATHGTAPKYAGQDKVNPGSVILSGEMMLRYMGWNEAADLIIRGMEGAIAAKTVTYDFARMMAGAQRSEVQRIRRRGGEAHGLAEQSVLSASRRPAYNSSMATAISDLPRRPATCFLPPSRRRPRSLHARGLSSHGRTD